MAMTSVQIQALVNDIFLFGDGSFDQFLTDDLIELLMAADDAYHNLVFTYDDTPMTNHPILSDENYNALHQYVETVAGDHTYFLGIGSQVRGGKVKLPYTMGSLTQAYQGDTQKWITQHNLNDQDIVITEKLDGCSALIVYGHDGKLQIAYSRGDGVEGADITRHVSKIHGIPLLVDRSLVVRAEILFSKKNWEIVKTKIKRSGGAFYKNARNATAGLMNASESDPVAYQYLSVVAYEILGEEVSKAKQLDNLTDLGFRTPVSMTVNGFDCTDEVLTKILNDMRDNSAYEIDGIVLDVNGVEARKRMNSTRDTLNPEFSRKFKVADASNYAEAEVIEVQFNVSKNGYLKPRVKIKSTELVGVTVQHCTGFNAKFIYDNKVGPGAIVGIIRAGDVIPFLQRVIKPMPVENMG